MIDADFVKGFTTSGRQAYDVRDTILYALGVGAGTDEQDFQYVFERDLRAVPTMAVVLAREAFWLTDPRTGIDVTKLLHGEQTLELHAPLPPSGDVRSELRVAGLYDKGPDKGAILDMRREPISRPSVSVRCYGPMAALAGSQTGCPCRILLLQGMQIS
jgi:hypothetical protein